MGIRHQSLQEDNGASLPDGVKIATLLNKTKGALRQHLQLRAGQIASTSEQSSWTSTKRAFSRAMAQTTMEDLRQWTLTTFVEKGETTKAKDKAKATTKETKAKASAEAKGATKGLTKATKEATTKEGTTRAKEKATQDPKAMDQAKDAKAKETTANQKEQEATTT